MPRRSNIVKRYINVFTRTMCSWLLFASLSFYLLSPTSSLSSEAAAILPSALSSSSNISSSSPRLTTYRDEMRLLNHFNVPYTHRLHGQLSINVSDVSTSSIAVRWRLSNRTYEDSAIESTVICETYSGMIVSKKIVSSTGSHRVEGLQSDTSYILCIYMLEKSSQTNTTILHFSCQNAATIPVLRSDSIIGVLLTLGYIFLMAAIGYFMWRKRSREISEDKIRINAEDDDDDDEDEDDEEEENNIHARSVSRAAVAATTSKHVTKASTNSGEAAKSPTGPAGTGKSRPESGGGGGGGGDVGDSNGCLDFRRSRDSGSLLCGATGAEMDDRRPKSGDRSLESSPIKVTEIAF